MAAIGSEGQELPEPPDMHIGRKAVELSLITADQLTQVLVQLSQSGSKSPPALGPTLVAQGLLTQQQLGILSDLASGAPPRRIGKYSIVRELGRGGMGVVYEAEDPSLRRRVALKTLLLNFGLSPEEFKVEEERFLREARLSANLPKHPHIVGVYEVGVADDQRFFAMEFVEGRQLSDWRKQKSVTLRQQVALIRDVALAAEHAHRHGVVHRDLKPANILVDKDHQPHVTDFGLAKPTRNEGSFALTVTGTAVGTPAYMSPEQAEAKKDLDHRTDVWSLGVMLFEMLTGRVPFEAETPIRVLMKTANDPVPTPSSVAKGPARAAIDRGIETVCMKALAKNPRARYASAKAFADDLTAWLKVEKAAAPPPAPTPKKAPPKPWLWIGIAAAVVLAIVGVLVLSGPSASEQAALRAHDFIEEGQRLLKREKYSDAIVKFGQALAEEPNSRAAAAGKKEAEEKLQAAGRSRNSATPPLPAPAPAPPPEDPARKAGEAAARELEALDSTIGLLRAGERFGEAWETLGRETLRHEDAAWKTGISSRKEDLRRQVDTLFAKVKEDAADLKRREAANLLEAQRKRVERWNWPGLVDELDGALAKVVLPTTPPAPPPKTDPAPVVQPPVPSPALGPAAKFSEIQPLLGGHQNGFNSLAFTTDGKGLLTTGWDNTVVLWDLTTRSERRRLSDNSGAVSTGVSPDGRWLSVGYSDGKVRLWEASTLQERTLTGHSAQVTTVTFTPDSKMLASSSSDGSARLWEVVTGTQKAQMNGHPSGAMSCALSPNGKLLAVGSAESVIILWDVASGRELKRLDIGGGTVRYLAFLPDGKTLVGGGTRSTVVACNIESGKSRVVGTHTKELRGIAVSSDGRWVASTAMDGLRIWDAAAGTLKAAIDGEAGFIGVAFSRKGDQLAAGAGNWPIRIWDITPLARPTPK